LLDLFLIFPEWIIL